MFVSTRTPNVFLGGGKVALVFEIIYLFFDLQGINREHFVLNSL